MLTHAFERLELPTQAQVDAFLPPFEPRQLLDPAEPVTIGAMVGPEAFTEVRYLGARQADAGARPDSGALGGAVRGARPRAVRRLLRGYRLQDADTVVVALGSVLGTIEDVIDELREQGVRIGALALKAFRPFPLQEVADALAGAKQVVVVERAFAIGLGGIVSQNVHSALDTHGTTSPRMYTAVAGLGGRPITKPSLRQLFADAIAGELHPVTFLDLDTALVERELERIRTTRRSGPHAENMVRDIGVVAAGPVGA